MELTTEPIMRMSGPKVGSLDSVPTEHFSETMEEKWGILLAPPRAALALFSEQTGDPPTGLLSTQGFRKSGH